MEIPTFSGNLRTDNLIPTVKKKNNYDLFNNFLGMVNQPQGHGPVLNQIGQGIAQGQAQPQQKPMDVVYQPSIGDIAREIAYGEKVHGTDLNKRAITPYQAGQLQLGRERIDASRDATDERNEIAAQNADTARKRVEIQEYAAKNGGLQIITNKVTGNTVAVGKDGRIVRDFGKTSLTDQELSDITQKRESTLIGERGTQQRQNIAATGEQQRQNITTTGEQTRITNSMPTTQIDTIRDNTGKVVEARSRFTQRDTPSSQGNSAIMYAPDGKAYTVPIAMTDQAQQDGLSFSKPKAK